MLCEAFLWDEATFNCTIAEIMEGDATTGTLVSGDVYTLLS
jgi:hypothetical protein